MKKFLWNFRNRLMDYRDDFDDAQTQIRLGELDKKVMPRILNAQGDDIYILRGIAHYRAQLLVRPFLSRLSAEFLSIPLLLAKLPGSLRKDNYKTQEADGFLVLTSADSEDRAHIFKIPDELSGLFIAKKYIPRANSLKRADWQIMRRLAWLLVCTRCPYPIQYLYKTLRDLQAGRAYIETFPHARIAVTAQEYSCSISLMTLQQHKAGNRLFNVMHGDNASSVLESYFIVDRFYCWLPFYAELFRRQRIAALFPIARNPDFSLKPGETIADKGIGVLVPMMHFLPRRFKNLEDMIVDYAKKITENLGDTPFTLRAHPTYPWTLGQFTAQALSAHITVSDARVEPAHPFILRHRTLIGFYSTVLVEAALLGCEVVILSYPASLTRARYHYVFQLPNVRHADLDDLPSILASLKKAEDMKGRI